MRGGGDGWSDVDVDGGLLLGWLLRRRSGRTRAGCVYAGWVVILLRVACLQEEEGLRLRLRL